MPTILLTTNTDPGLPAISFDGSKIAVAVNGSVQVLGVAKDEAGMLLFDTTNGSYQHTEGVVDLPFNPSISDDGATVLFESADLSLGSGLLQQSSDAHALYVWRAGNSQPVVVSDFSTTFLNLFTFLGQAVLSGDGHSVAVVATNIDDGNNCAIFKIDISNATFASVVAPKYHEGYAFVPIQPSLSNDGDSLAYTQLEGNSDAWTFRYGVFQRSSANTEEFQLNAEPDGRTPTQSLSTPIFSSGDGRYVAFETYRQESDDKPGLDDPWVYVKDTATGALIDAATTAAGIHTLRSDLIGLSDDGRFLAFFTLNPVGIDQRPYNLYVKDLQTGGIADAWADRPIVRAAMSGDGKTIVAVLQDGEQYQVVSLPVPTFTTVTSNDDIVGTTNGDTLIGYLGDDRYIVDHGKDLVIEHAGGGIDTVVASVDYALPDNVENLQAAGTTALSLNGNALNNTIFGNGAANIVFAGDGVDTVDAGGGNDNVESGAGDDTVDAGSGNDTISGGPGDDVIHTGGGSDHVDAGAGDDTVILPASAGGYTWLNNGDVVILNRVTGGDAVMVSNAEHIQAGALHIEFGEYGHAGEIIRLYQAAFNRLPDATGLGFWIAQMDGGASIDSVAHAFTQAAEFYQRFPAGTGSADMVEGYYRNVLHRAGDPGGIAFWADKVDTGVISPAELLHLFSDSPENIATMVGVLEKGYGFLEYAP